MSTNNTPSKLTSPLVFISGAYLFFITLVLTPYVNFTVLSDSYTITKLLMVGSAAVIAALQLTFLVPRVSKNLLNAFPKLFSRFLSVSLIAVVVSILFSTSLKTSLFGMFTAWESNVMIFLCYLLLLGAWLVYYLVLREYALEKIVFHTLLTLALIVAIIYSVGEYYVWKSTTGYVSQSVSRISLGFRNPLFAAYFLGMLWSYSAGNVISSLVKTSLTAVQKLASIGNYLLFVGISWSLLLTFTRSAWIAAGLTFVGLFIIQTISGIKNSPKQMGSVFLRLSVIAATLLMTVFVLGYSYKKEIGLRNTDISIESQNTLAAIAQSIGKGETPEEALSFYQQSGSYSSSQIRLLEWKWGVQTWMGSVKNFLVGTGPDGGFFEMPKYRDAIFNNFPTDSATKPFYVRNLYINFLMQFGAILSVAVAYLFVVISKKIFLAGDFSAIAIIIGFLTQGIFYYPSHLPMTLVIFAVAYLFATVVSTEKLSVRVPTTFERVTLLIAVIGIIGWLFPILQASYKVSMYTQMVLPVPQTEMEKDSKILINNNIMKRFLVYHYSDSALAAKYLPKLAASNDVDDLRIASDAYYLLARKNNSLADVKSSIEVSKKLLEIDATLPATWDGLGLRYLFIGEFNDARDAFTKALALKEDYWYGYLHMGELARQQCNPKEAIDWYTKAKQYVPSTDVEIQEAKDEIKTPRSECR